MAKQKTKLSAPRPSTAGLPQKAALVLFNASQWTARVGDLSVTRKVIADAGASAEAGRFNKSLLPGDTLVKQIAKNISEFRQDYLYTVTLPWGDDGWRLIPAQRISEFRAKFRKHEDIHNQLVAQLLTEYEDKVEKAKASLGSLFKHTDYPPVAALANKYRFALDWNSIADADDLRVQVSEEASAEIRKEITEATERKLNRAVTDTFARVHEVVARVADRLTADKDGETKIFRDSLIGNVRDLAEVLPSLNITNDPTLAKVVEDLHNKLGKLDPDVLRNEPAAAAAAVKTAQDILAELDGAI